ncbi:MAG: hypothetical protein R2843_01980 [Thermomicrobiales bacterium]
MAVDRDPLHLACASANAEVYGLADRVSTLEADVTEIDLAGIDAIFIDPARRGETGRFAHHTEPPMSWVYGLVDRVPNVAAKAAPGIDHDSVPPGWEIEFIAEGRALKEAALWSPELATAPRRATLVPDGISFVAIPGEPVAIAPPGGYLIDPIRRSPGPDWCRIWPVRSTRGRSIRRSHFCRRTSRSIRRGVERCR